MIRRALLVLALLAPLAATAGEGDVAAAAAAALEARWPTVAPRTEVRVVRLSGAAAQAAPPLRVRFPEAEAPRGRVSAEVEARDADGAWAPVGWAFLEVAHFETAAVLTRDVPRGAPIPPDAVRVARVETTDLREPVVPPGALAERLAGRTLRAGTVLTTRDAVAPPAVERGAPVRVHYARGAVRIVLDGEARQTGAVGDEVRVYCSDTRSTFRVRLTAPGEGEWVGTL